MADWSPQQYGKFAAERAQPFWDLVGLVETGRIRRAVDLGCGPGELTADLGVRLAIDDLVGVDSSATMLAAAAAHARPGLRFEAGDIGSWSSAGDHDLVLANASLHWVPDHPAVLARWWSALAPGGQLAVQVPASADHPSHIVAGETATAEPFRSAMGGAPPADPVAVNVLRAEEYAVLLHELGAVRQHVRLQVYGHALTSTAEVVEWMRGTSLTRFFKVLPAELHEPFVDEYRTRLLDVIGDRAPYFYPFKRILFRGARA